MADDSSATPVAAAPAAQPAESETKTPAVGDLKLDDTPAEPVESKDEGPKATPAEKPAEPESKPDTVKQDEDTAKPTEGKSSVNSALHMELTLSVNCDISADHRHT